MFMKSGRDYYSGDSDLLQRSLLALFCSIRCPGDLILKTYDLARALRDAGIPVIGGFHTPMEKECLRFLLRGTLPIVVCPARGIEAMRIPREWKEPIDQGRLLIASPFPAQEKRVTAKLADQRNRFVVEHATSIFVSYAEQGGKTEALCQSAIDSGKQVFTFDHEENANLLGMGARRLEIEAVNAGFDEW